MRLDAGGCDSLISLGKGGGTWEGARCWMRWGATPSRLARSGARLPQIAWPFNWIRPAARLDQVELLCWKWECGRPCTVAMWSASPGGGWGGGGLMVWEGAARGSEEQIFVSQLGASYLV